VLTIYGILLVAALVLAWRGYLVPARLVIPLGGLIVFGYLMLINRGIRDIALLGLPVIIIASGLLFGKTGTLLYGTLSFATLVFIGIAEANGLIPTPILIQNSLIDYISAGIAIGLVMILQWLVIDRLNLNIRTAQKNAEAQKQANEALRISEARYRALIEESPQGILITDERGYIILANSFAIHLLGYEEAELIGKFAPDLIAPEDLAQRPVPVDDLRAGAIIQRERLLLRQDGTRLAVMGSNRHMPDGRFQYIFQDITQQKQIEAEREALIRELENKNAELERFTYTVSHDLKSPLVTIRGFLGLLEQDIAKGDHNRTRSDLRRIANATDHMNRLLMDLLELSRIGRLMNPYETVAFETIVREALDLTHGQLKARGVTVQVMPSLPAVHGDRARLVEVLQNLIDNAVKFIGTQAAPQIEIGVRAPAGEPVIFVRDNGIGIAPEFHERVFGLFNRLDQSIEGTGIGLTLVKRIIEVHGGRIWIESNGDGNGTTVCFTVPNSHAPASLPADG
jgi:PAS domain S-box-containing protein